MTCDATVCLQRRKARTLAASQPKPLRNMSRDTDAFLAFKAISIQRGTIADLDKCAFTLCVPHTGDIVFVQQRRRVQT